MKIYRIDRVNCDSIDELKISFQDFLFANLGELMNQHVFHDKKSVAGQVVIELGRAETYLIRCSRAQTGESP